MTHPTIAVLSLLAMACRCTALHAQALQFSEEEVRVHVQGRHCTVTGTYTFTNHSDREIAWSLFYPLLETPQLPFPDEISVFDTTRSIAPPFSTSKEGIAFPVSTPPRSRATYRISYKQRTLAARMEYILTTTRNWGRPLDRATFVVTIPDSLQLTSISIPCDSVKLYGNDSVFSSRRHNFLPEENLILSWRRKEP
jgi:hypothetical protein